MVNVHANDRFTDETNPTATKRCAAVACGIVFASSITWPVPSVNDMSCEACPKMNAGLAIRTTPIRLQTSDTLSTEHKEKED